MSYLYGQFIGMLTVFAEKTIEKSFISHLVGFTIDHDDQRIVCKQASPALDPSFETTK
jgi:hypothetical protein